MATGRLRTALSAVVGMLVGYVIWLGAVGLIIVTTPVRSWVPAVAIVVAVLSLCAVLLGRRCTNTWKAAGFWSAPVLPIVVSVYLLVVVVT
jgi:hypothetical protein